MIEDFATDCDAILYESISMTDSVPECDFKIVNAMKYWHIYAIQAAYVIGRNDVFFFFAYVIGLYQWN